MPIYNKLDHLAGLPVVDFEAGTPLLNAGQSAWRIEISYDEAEEGESWDGKFHSFLNDAGAAEVEALVVGNWGEVMSGDNSTSVIEALVAAAERLARLKHLFIGDITGEECEISWINQSNVSELFDVYPNLQSLAIRGGQALSLVLCDIPI